MSYTFSISATVSTSPPKKYFCPTTAAFRGKPDLSTSTLGLSSSPKDSVIHDSCPTSQSPQPKSRPPMVSPPITSSPRRIFKRSPETATGFFPRSSRSRSDSNAEMRPSDIFGPDDESAPAHSAITTKPDTLHALKLKAQRSIPMLRSHSSPASTSTSGTSPPPKGSRPRLFLADTPRPSMSSEDTAIDIDSDYLLVSFRKRAKVALGKPALTHSQSLLGSTAEPFMDEEEVDVSDTATEVDFEDGLDDNFSDAETVAPGSLPPKTWSPPVQFKLLEPTSKYGGKHAPQPSFEVPYPISYDKVLLECDDHTHDLIKALIPNRHGLSFHDFAKPPSSVLDLGCGEGRWVLEAAQQWKHTRFVGLDLMDIQPELSNKGFEDVRDRVQWVHSNFLHYRLPFEDGQFDYIRMSYVSMAIPGYKWKSLISELRRVLKSNVGVLEWIDEDPTVLPLTAEHEGSTHHQLEHEFRSFLKARDIAGGRPRSLFKTVPTLLKGRAMFAKCTEVARFNLALPGQEDRRDTNTSPRNEKHSRLPSARSPSRNGRPSLDYDATSEPKPLPPLPPVSPGYRVPRGLIVLPENRLLPLSPSDLEAQATRNYQVLLGCRDSLWKHRLESNPDANKEQFDNQIWDYQCGRYERLRLPQQTCCSWDDSDDEAPAPSLSFPLSLSALNHRRRAPSPLPTPKPHMQGDKPTLVRSIRVFIAQGDGK